MTAPNSFHVSLLLGKLQEVLRLDPGDVEALCQIGGELIRLGRAQEARKCYRAAVDALRRFIQAGDADLALNCEGMIYETFVKAVEEEQHYYRCFADWKGDLAMFGRRFRDPATPSRDGSGRIAFFLHMGHILGHTEVLLKMLESRPRGGGHDLEPRVYILHTYDPAFVERCRAAGVEVVRPVDIMGEHSPWDARFVWLRERFKQDRIGVCVWVSVPTMAAFALSMRLAPVQIFWALRFHPLAGPYIDGYITWGTPGETTRRYGNQDWEVVPMPLAIDDSQPDSPEVKSVRDRYPEEILLGTLAREEKINSASYLKAVAEVLAANPRAGFVWTGRGEHAGIAGFFRAAGVADRCHFAGWVDTKLYAAALDVFLETFPFGSGVTAFQALGAGTPLLSYLHPETIFGTYFLHEVASADKTAADRSRRLTLDAPDRYPILCARDEVEYVTLAGRLISDAAWRKEIGERGHAFFREELQNNAIYAERFFATITRIAAAKRAGNAPGATVK